MTSPALAGRAQRKISSPLLRVRVRCVVIYVGWENTIFGPPHPNHHLAIIMSLMCGDLIASFVCKCKASATWPLLIQLGPGLMMMLFTSHVKRLVTAKLIEE